MTESTNRLVERLRASADFFEKHPGAPTSEDGHAFLREAADALEAAEAERDSLRAQRDAYKEALEDIASFDDRLANEKLERTGSYGSFDEPGSVQIARAALSTERKGDTRDEERG